ncbi:MAG: hypothetical protein NTX29_15035, partial [Actinobacteria bacterium]|nr:hypothetical protein [Actinomycetota bacterium]
MTATQMSAQDALWLTMDRPNNLMVVDVAVVLAGALSIDDLRVGFEGLVARHPVFGRRAESRGTSWHWVDDPDFDIDRHVRMVDLPAGSRMVDVQRYVAEARAQAFDRDHPLWSAVAVGPVTLTDGAEGSVVITRFHHAIADGVRLTQVLLGMLDPSSAGDVPMVSRDGTSGGALVSVDSLRAGAAEALRVTSTSTRAVASALTRAVTNPLATVSSLGGAAMSGLKALRHPDRFVDALEVLGIDDHRSVNDVTSVSKLLTSSTERTVWTGKPGLVKAVAWSDPMPLEGVKQVARRHGATVNDVL